MEFLKKFAKLIKIEATNCKKNQETDNLDKKYSWARNMMKENENLRAKSIADYEKRTGKKAKHLSDFTFVETNCDGKIFCHFKCGAEDIKDMLEAGTLKTFAIVPETDYDNSWEINIEQDLFCKKLPKVKVVEKESDREGFYDFR